MLNHHYKDKELLDEYIDPEMMLYAACKIYDVNKLKGLMTRRQYSLFATRVIGLIQSLLSPESAHVVSRGMANHKTIPNESDECMNLSVKRSIASCTREEISL